MGKNAEGAAGSPRRSAKLRRQEGFSFELGQQRSSFQSDIGTMVTTEFGLLVGSEVVEETESLDAVEALSFPVYGELKDMQAIGSGSQQHGLPGRTEIGRASVKK